MTTTSPSLTFTAIPGVVDVAPGLDLVTEITRALGAAAVALEPYDILVVAQKIVSKSEGRYVDLRSIQPSARARELADATRKDARLIEVILSESSEVVRVAPNVLITRHRLGFVMANAGIDASNVLAEPGRDLVLLLPTDPDAAAENLARGLAPDLRMPFGIIISDSFGRPWRNGVVNVALGAAGLPSLIDRRGESDRYGRKLQVTQVAFADAVASGAALVMGEGAEGHPVVHVRGMRWSAPERTARALLRPLEEDLFR